MKTISTLEYVKMQASLCGRQGSNGSHAEDAKRVVDDILIINGVTISDEAEVKPMSENDFFREWKIAYEKGDSYLVIEALKSRGLIK